MSQFTRDSRGARDFSSPQIRVRGAGDFRQYSSERLRLPGERKPLGPAFRRLFGVLFTLALVGGIGIGVYFGVSELLMENEAAPAVDAETVEPMDSAEDAQADASAAPVADEADAGSDTDSAPSAAQPQATAETETESTAADSGSAPDESAEPVEAEPQSEAAQPESAPIAVATLAPSVADQPVTPAQIGGAETVAERVTAEPIPSGIPRALADGADYDPTESATVFTSRWPVGTTLRLTRLPGATLLTDEQQAQVIGAQTLVVVRATESSNTDLQLSPAAFDLLAFYGVERIIAVRVEVTAGPPP